MFWRMRPKTSIRAKNHPDMGAVISHLSGMLARQITDHGVVVWYDTEGHYRQVTEHMAAQPGSLPLHTTVAVDDGSLFALRKQVDHLINGTEPPHILVYVPRSKAETGDALVELESMGVVMAPGAQSRNRNTRLSLVVREALKPILGEGGIADIEKQVELGRLSLADCERLAEQGGSLGAGVISLVFGTANAAEVALTLLTTEQHDQALVEKNGIVEVIRLLNEGLDAQIPNDLMLIDVRKRLGRHVLVSEIAHVLGALPGSLASVPAAVTPAGRTACAQVASRWRGTTTAGDAYAAEAVAIDDQLSLTAQSWSAAHARQVQGLKSAAIAFIEQVERGLVSEPSESLLQAAVANREGFWAEQDPVLSQRWALVHAAGQVISRTLQQELALTAGVIDAAGFVAKYTTGEQPWCLTDTHQRIMEQLWHDFDFDHAGQHQTLDLLINHARHRFATVGSMGAERFTRAWQAIGFAIPHLPRQLGIFDDWIKPRLGEEKIAYVWVDALRFEMARQLVTEVLDRDFTCDLGAATATPPTITEIGMAALLPGAGNSPAVVPVDKGKLGLSINGTVIATRADRIQWMRDHVAVPMADIRLESLLPKPSKKDLEQIKQAQLVLVTSQEIDELCEKGNVLLARKAMDGVMEMLTRACRLLASQGVTRIFLTSDHGYLFGEEVGEEQKVEAPGGKTADLHRRVWVGTGGNADPAIVRTPLSSFGLGGDLEVAAPLGFAAFKAKGGGLAYFHGGLSPQEVLIPLVELVPKRSFGKGTSQAITWSLISASKVITTRVARVRITGECAFQIDGPTVQIEVLNGQEIIGEVIGAEHGWNAGSRLIQMKATTDAGGTEPNAVTIRLTKKAGKQTTIRLLDETGRLLASVDITTAISM